THRDLQSLGADMGMNAEAIAWARVNLGAGRFIVTLADGPWRHPFVIQVPHLRIPSIVDDAEAARSMQALAHLPHVRASEYDRWTPFPPVEVRPTPSGADESVTDAPAAELDPAELRFLKAIVDNPGCPSSSLPRLARLSPKRAIELREDLIRR